LSPPASWVTRSLNTSVPPSCFTPRKRADGVRGQLQGTDSGYTLSARDHLARRGSF